jgi:hypothetical protein
MPNLYVQRIASASIIVFGAAAAASTLAPRPVQAASEAPDSEPLGTEYDCVHACTDCQKACESQPAGSQRTDCQKACTAAAAGCCSGYGKKPPPGMTCACQ